MWVRQTIATQDAERAAAEAETVYPDPVACAVGDLKVEAVGPETVNAGAGATFTLEVTNSGAVACLFDAGSGSVGVQVTSGPSTVWDSNSCPVGEVERSLLLNKGDKTSVSLQWNGYLVGADCVGAQLPAGGVLPTPSPAASDAPTDAPTASASDGATDSPSAQPSAQPSADAASAGGGASVAKPGTYRYRFTIGGKEVTQPELFVVE